MQESDPPVILLLFYFIPYFLQSVFFFFVFVRVQSGWAPFGVEASANAGGQDLSEFCLTPWPNYDERWPGFQRRIYRAQFLEGDKGTVFATDSYHVSFYLPSHISSLQDYKMRTRTTCALFDITSVIDS